MRLKTVAVALRLLLGVSSIVAVGCTFTHSLNDLQGGSADSSGSAPDVPIDRDAGLVYPPHTIAITGDNQFTASETFLTSRFAYPAYVAWDRDTFYFAVEGPSVESNDPATWVVAYWGTAGSSGMGTRTGQTYGNQTPTLNFDANYHLRWKGDDSLISLMRSSPGGWQDGGAFVGQHQRKGRFVEFSVPLRTIFAPGDAATHTRFVLAVIHDAAPETTYASLPASAVVQDNLFNPPYQHSFDFDLTGGTLPNQHAPQ